LGEAAQAQQHEAGLARAAQLLVRRQHALEPAIVAAGAEALDVGQQRVVQGQRLAGPPAAHGPLGPLPQIDLVGHRRRHPSATSTFSCRRLSKKRTQTSPPRSENALTSASASPRAKTSRAPRIDALASTST